MSDLSVQIFSYARCSTCRKALKWLELNKIPYKVMDIIQEPPSLQLLSKAIHQVEKRSLLFNTSGVSYRQLGGELIKSMTDQQALEALASDGKLIKRPFLVKDNSQILVGFKPEKWSETFLE